MEEITKVVITIAALMLIAAVCGVIGNLTAEKCPRHPNHRRNEVRVFDLHGFEVGTNCAICESEAEMVLARLRAELSKRP